MKAVTWHEKGDMRCEIAPDPTIEQPREAIIRVTACAICGLHIYNGMIPSMQHGDVMGHETMGEVVEVGAEVKGLKRATALRDDRQITRNDRPYRGCRISTTWIRSENDSSASPGGIFLNAFARGD